MYGRSPFDLAMAEGMDDVISKLSGLVRSEFSKSDSYKLKFIMINQHVLIEKFNLYLKLTGRTSEYLNLEGMCNGLSFIAGCFADQGMIKEFYDILEMIAQWNPQTMSLQDSELITNLPKDYNGEPYKNIGDVFERFLNEITWHHQHGVLEKETGISQAERQKQFEVSSNKKILEQFAVAFIATKPQLTNILEHVAKEPNRMVMISGGKHSTEVYILPNNHFAYYDPTLDYRPSEFTDPEKLSNFIQEVKYQYLKQFSDLDKNMELYISAYQIYDEHKNVAVVDLSKDEEFLNHLLTETSAFFHDGELDSNLMKKSLAIACYFYNPQSVRALLKYGKYDDIYMLEAFEKAVGSLSTSCLVAVLEEGYKVSKDTLVSAEFLFKVYITNPSQMDKLRHHKIMNILTYYYNHPLQSSIHDPIYPRLIATIEKNSPENLSLLLEQQTVNQEFWQDLIRRAILLEKKPCIELLLNKINFPIDSDLAMFAKNTLDLDLDNVKNNFKFLAKIGK